jgi:hypothetical protein
MGGNNHGISFSAAGSVAGVLLSSVCRSLASRGKSMNEIGANSPSLIQKKKPEVNGLSEVRINRTTSVGF